MNIFGERLHTLRTEKKITLRELANALNMSYSALGNYERGVREPSIDIIKKIADFFDVSVEYILGLSDDRFRITTYDVLYGASFSTQRKLANMIDSLSDEERFAVISYIEFLISKRNNDRDEATK